MIYSADTIASEKYWSRDCGMCPFEAECDKTECRKEDYRQAKIEDKIDKAMEGLD